MPIATNDKGEALYLDAGEWKPAKIAKNPQTGESLAFDGTDWKSVKTAGPKSLSDVGISAVKNIPASAGRMAADIRHTIAHPVETAENLGAVGLGVLQHLGAPGESYKKYADAVGKFFMDRYGSVEAIKNTIATDPVGAAADVATILSGGETALARIPGVVGRVGEVAGTASRAVDPLSAAGLAVKGSAAGASELIGGLGTYTGGRSIRTAAQAGYEGGQAAETFQKNLRGGAAPAEMVADARKAVTNIRLQRGQEYRDAMTGIQADKTVLDFDKVDDALTKISQIKTFKGVPIEAESQGIREQIGQAVAEWKLLDPAEYHTAEGLDALKQKIGSIRDNTEYGTPANKIANEAYHAVRQTIVDQAPEYGRIMKAYEEASDQIREIEKTLSLNPNASIDTALRKLQSVLRNNVHTNYGQREKLAEYLVNSGAPHLMEAIAGQSLNAWVPRGLAKMVASQILAAGGGAAAAGALGAGALAIPTVAAMSPRLVGETAYYAGKAAGKVPARPLARGAYYLGQESPLDPGPLANQSP